MKAAAKAERSARAYAEGERHWQEKLRRQQRLRKPGRRQVVKTRRAERRSLFAIQVTAPANAKELAVQSYREQQAREAGRR